MRVLGLGARPRATRATCFAVAFCCPSPTSRATPPVGTGPARELRASLEDRHRAPPPRLRGRTSSRGQRRSPASAEGARPSRRVLVGRPFRRATPSILLRTTSRETSAYVTAVTTAFSGSRAPSVHLLGRASTSTPPPCAVTTSAEEPASSAARPRARAGSRSALGLVLLWLFPDQASTRRDGWRERRSRGGGPEGRGTQGETASSTNAHGRSPGRTSKESPWVAHRRADRRGETRAPGPVRRRSCSPPRS
jgi:hypothetical protein